MRLKGSAYFETMDLPLAVVRIDPHEPMELHTHEFCELVLIQRGSGIHRVGTRPYPVKAGDVFVINGRRRHGYEETSNLALVNILYNPALLATANKLLADVSGFHILFALEHAFRDSRGFDNRMHLSLADLRQVNGWVDALEKELGEKAPGFRFQALVLFMQIVGYLARIYEAASVDTSAELVRMGKVITHLEKEYRSPIALDDVARIAHMSRRNLTRVFARVMGQSPIGYLIRLRVNRAADLLRNSSMKISAIGYEAGFEDSNYFSRQFRHLTGMTPRAFRRREAGR